MQGAPDSWCGAFRDFGEQILRRLLQLEDIGANFSEGAELRRLVEVAGEADLVADLGVGLHDPRGRRVQVATVMASGSSRTNGRSGFGGMDDGKAECAGT